MKRSMRLVAVAVAVLVAVAPVAATADEPDTSWKETKREAKRQRIDATAGETLEELFADSAKAKELYDNSVAYAVFDNLKLSLIISGGGGNGVAVDKASGKRTYMQMGTVGLNIGLGGQKYQVVFLFQDHKTFKDFVKKGWQADASANAVAGTEGVNPSANFVNGLAVFQITEAGLMLQADIAGTKYWKNKKLN